MNIKVAAFTVGEKSSNTKIYDKHDDFNFEIVNFPFLDGDVPHSSSYGVYISQLVCFARVSSYVKSLLRQGLSEPEFYVDLVYKLKKIVGSNNFSAQFIKIISHYKKIGYNIDVLKQTACLVVNPITVGNFAFLFNCTPVDWTSDSMTVAT